MRAVVMAPIIIINIPVSNNTVPTVIKISPLLTYYNTFAVIMQGYGIKSSDVGGFMLGALMLQFLLFAK